MRTLVAIPCMDMMHTRFVASLVGAQLGEDYEFRFGVSSLVYDTRNDFIKYALENKFDRMIQIDSDMCFEPYIFDLWKEDLDKGFGIVSSLCFKRRPPYTPVIFSECDTIKHKDGRIEPVHRAYLDYPEDTIFDIAACGFGAVAMDMQVVNRIVETYGRYLFAPVAGFGEDLSFCLRARSAGFHIYCDSRIKVGHVGQYVYDEEMFRRHNDGSKQ